MDSAFVIRLSYGPALEPEWRLRADLFRDRVLPRLRDQTIPADIWVWTHSRHADEARSWDVQTFTVENAPDFLSAKNTPWSDVRGMPRYAVQMLLGSDDLIGPEFHATAIRSLSGIPERRAIVTFQPHKYDLASGRTYRMPDYTPDRCSPFVALRQDVDDPAYTWVWTRGHTRLHETVDRVVVVPEGHALLTVHTRNLSTDLTSADEETEAPPWL